MGYQKINNLGVYGSLSELWSAHPEGGREGDFALVGGTEYYWNKYERNWSGSPSDQPSAGYPTTTVDGDFHVSNDLFVGGNIHVRGDVYAEGENIPVTPGEGGEGGEGGSYDDTDLKTRMNAVERGIENLRANKQDKLTPGNGIKITGTTISVDPDYIPSEGGGGSAAAVDFIQDASEATDGDTLYFFSHSRLQGVGLYNTLLQEGSLTGTDGKTYVYHPGKLYHLYSDGSFREIEPDSKHYVTFDGNKVYYHHEEAGAMVSTLCSLPRYGSAVLNSRLKYADTSDTAVLMVSVSGPFYADVTELSVRFDATKVRVYEYRDGSLHGMSDGDVLSYRYADFYVPRTLHVVRRHGSVNELSEAMDTDLWLDSGAERVRVRVKFSASKVFYKDGNVSPMSGVPGFDPSSLSNPKVTSHSDHFLVRGGDAAYEMAIADEIVIDRRRRNVFYAKLVSLRGTPPFKSRAYLSGTDTLYYDTEYCSSSSTEENKKHRFLERNGIFALQCHMQDYRLGGEVLLDLSLYLGTTGDVSVGVSELGVLTYSEITEDDYQ